MLTLLSFNIWWRARTDQLEREWRLFQITALAWRGLDQMEILILFLTSNRYLGDKADTTTEE